MKTIPAWSNLNSSDSRSHSNNFYDINELESLDAVTARYIKQVLEKTNGKINGSGGAAEILGINPNTLRNKMKKLGIPFGKEMSLNLNKHKKI